MYNECVTFNECLPNKVTKKLPLIGTNLDPTVFWLFIFQIKIKFNTIKL